ncbi:hypothetical protein PENTCL1PPCAC_27615 [Pristionchus entomophagus]|uniref:MOSC domain-containing protein n=1 Tax=Pristionchus entomophagus TaxID=358040 RepID=A0AAV5UEN5_9BILA|nr:hypothetical protein PENTCL1PPCAC_27615 [Pristionchus entomophagus]
MAYCDYAGAALPSAVQLDAIHTRLSAFPLANPHSRHAVSGNTAALVESARARIYKHLHTTPDEYDLVFTSNTTHSIHVIAENFVFPDKERPSGDPLMVYTLGDCRGPSYVYLLDSHTSVVGAREIVRDKIDSVCCLDDLPEDWEKEGKPTDSIRSLFVMTAMSNFCGRKYPLSAVHEAQKRGFSVVLDAASLVSSSPLRLDICQPHFVVFSFYKMFGYPTGLAALLIHRSARGLLHKRSFAGGTVTAYLPQQLYHADKDIYHRRFEEGTPNYYAMAALREGFEELDRCGGIDAIHSHCDSIVRAAREMLRGQKHANGRPLCVLYEHEENPSSDTKGPTIAFNLMRHDGSTVGFIEVEKMADLFGIHLRMGCFCNAGACQKYLKLSNEDLKANFESGKRCGDLVDLIDGRPVGAVRLSFGKDSTMQDIALISSMLSCCFIGGATPTTRPPSIPLESPVRARVDSLHVYPVKSCRGLRVDSWSLSSSGLSFDRHFSIVSSDVTLTQKRVPRLCRIVPKIDLASSTLLLCSEDEMEGEGHGIQIPLASSSEGRIGSTASNIVCTSNIQSRDVGSPSVSAWLSEQLDFPSCVIRRVEGGKATSSPSRSFSNDSPYLLVSYSSAAVISSSIGMKVDEYIRRFRPNIVVSGLPPFIEDDAEEVDIDGYLFEVVNKCVRCEMICIDQSTGDKDPSALLALRESRKGEGITFGIYLRERDARSETIRTIGNGSSVILSRNSRCRLT